MSTIFYLQLLVVVSPNWNSPQGSLYLFERDSEQLDWQLARDPIPVALGKNGMAWGKGLHPLPQGIKTLKREGDGKTPAGFYSIGPAFGDKEHQPHAKKIPYVLITEDLECVDDPHSRYYNQFVHSGSIIGPDWKSSEKMAEIGQLYALGFVVEHNYDPIVPGDGSAIFFHIWRTPQQGSAGCTTMAEIDLKQVVEWLDGNSLPRVVQLPLSEYEQRIEEWGLPNLRSDLLHRALPP
ncbi:MAG: L,D-transpeptidase family protein [Parachlamydiales bacterium]|nr:L,D-transpeptidase family protein [Candidatus Acheromyda pituitae]